MQKVAIFQHADGEWIGSMRHWFANKPFQLTTYRLDHDDPLPSVAEFDWLLIMGGPMSTYDENNYPWLIGEKQLIREAIDANKTVLGICLGSQLIASALGARVYPNSQQEIGWFPVSKIDPEASWMPEDLRPLSWHGDCVELPENACSFADSAITECQGFYFGPRIWALQFHLEVEPGTVEAFLALESHPLPETSYVQNESMLMDNSEQLKQSQQAMFALLDVLHRESVCK
ncbi:type 1 glutamine amidotransferase [Methylophaga sp.]|jgi:GMP synthase-like glutamine amidotransferase|uniref:type 1 glutamine amidotransferase n=1 Tax=Methylophaga sp. TaxID=2024840 RepID=UPI003A9466AB